MATQKPLILSSSGQVQRLPTSDTLDLGTLGTGVADNTTFLRGDGSWATPSTAATSLALSSLTASTGANTLASADNAQVWQWSLTSIVKSGLTLTESTASINGSDNQILLDVSTVAASTAAPLRITARGVESLRIDSAGVTTISGGVKIPSGTPASGKVLTSDASGVATWQAVDAGAAAADVSIAMAIALG